MARPAVRTHYAPPDVQREVLLLFGTITNAHKRLRLTEARVPRNELARALHGDPVREEHSDAIQDAWRRWKREFLAGYATQARTEFNDFTLEDA